MMDALTSSVEIDGGGRGVGLVEGSYHAKTSYSPRDIRLAASSRFVFCLTVVRINRF